ncbi:MAG: fliN [Thermoleophilia bacterium]|nr:fliN [Thermoleophilia bacterium]
MIAEAVGQAVSDAITSAVGTNVDLGIAASCIPEDMLAGRPLPLRAIVVRFARPLRDVMIFVSSLREDVVRPLVEVAAVAALTSLDVPVDLDDTARSFTIEPAVEYAAMEDAVEDCDALFLEATYGMDLPTGELQMVLGTGLLESASCFTQGIEDPYLEDGSDPRVTGDGGLVLGAQLGGMDDDGSRYELGDGVMGGETEDTGLVLAAAAIASGADDADAPSAGGSLEALDAMLAQQEQAERDAIAAIEADARAARAGAVAETASANVAAAELPEFVDVDPAARWTQLLSGVEVELSAELGRMDLALGDITSLAADSVLTLDQLVTEPVGVFVNGTRYATARLVVVDGEYGIEILEVVEQPELLAPTFLAA